MTAKMPVSSGKVKVAAAHFLNGEFQYETPAKCMTVRNPATGDVVGFLPDSVSAGLIGAASEWAAKDQEYWHWEVQEQEKELVFRAIIKKFEEHMGPLVRTISIESGKLWKWAVAEAQETVDTLWHYHGEISRAYTHDGFTRCQMPNKNAFSLRIPYGKILKISPWNFPLAVPMWAVCGALAGGNSILLKPAEQTPFTMQYASLLIHEALKETFSPERYRHLKGLLQIVHGPGETSGKLLTEEFDYDKVTFTGSGAVGFRIAATAASRVKNGRPYGKPCHLELGGHAAMVVLDDFDTDLAVAEAITANLGDSGQRCVSTRVIFVQERHYQEFVNKFVAAARARRIGHNMDFKTEMGPIVSREQLDRIHEMVMKTTEQLGRNPVLGGFVLNRTNMRRIHEEKLNVDEDAVSRGSYYAPTVFTNVPYGVTAMDDEIFGPVVVINPLAGNNREEAFWNALELVNKSDAGLSNALLTNDRRLSSRAPGRFRTGILYIGRGTTGAELNKYFAAIKASGWGIEGKGLDHWTQIQQVYDDFHGKARMAQAGSDSLAKKMFDESISPLDE